MLAGSVLAVQKCRRYSRQTVTSYANNAGVYFSASCVMCVGDVGGGRCGPWQRAPRGPRTICVGRHS